MPIGSVGSGSMDPFSHLRPAHVPHRPCSRGSGQLPDGSIWPTPILSVKPRIFFKRLKKLNSKRGADLENFQKWVPPARSTGGRRGVGDIPPIQRAGGANKKLFLFTKRPLPRRQRHPAHPAGGMCSFSYFLFEFMFYKLFKIYTFFKYKIYSPYSFVYI
jgi:hypothetical protein